MSWFLVLIFFAMCFCHVVDDYYLQGILASMKQKNWWTKQESYEDKYKNDYVIALIMHAFSWSFMILIPFLLLGLPPIFLVIALVFNGTIHAFVDDLKANQKKINLVQDQSIHIGQIFLTWLIGSLIYI
jgi:hypothetical protein